LTLPVSAVPVIVIRASVKAVPPSDPEPIADSVYVMNAASDRPVAMDIMPNTATANASRFAEVIFI
jgi:hypothetical protein